MPLIDFGGLNLPIEEKKKISKNSYLNYLQLWPGIALNFGGLVSHEFAIFAKFFCIDLLNALY